MDVVMNDITSTDDEAEVTFGMVKTLFYVYLYNLRISFSSADILLAMADVKACFRSPRSRPCLAGAFGFFRRHGLLPGHINGFWFEYISHKLGTFSTINRGPFCCVCQ